MANKFATEPRRLYSSSDYALIVNLFDVLTKRWCTSDFSIVSEKTDAGEIHTVTLDEGRHFYTDVIVYYVMGFSACVDALKTTVFVEGHNQGYIEGIKVGRTINAPLENKD